MAQAPDPIKLKRDLLAALDECIEQGPWDKSLFLTTTIKPLRDLRDKLKEELAKSEIAKEPSDRLTPERLRSREGYSEVYVLLYTSKGSHIRNWESVLAGLRTTSINRPIYKNEDDVKDSIRQKATKQNEGYACVLVREEDLRAPVSGQATEDRFGHPLITVKMGSIDPDNITRFMHVTGKYRFKNGILRKENDIDTAELI